MSAKDGVPDRRAAAAAEATKTDPAACTLLFVTHLCSCGGYCNCLLRADRCYKAMQTCSYISHVSKKYVCFAWVAVACVAPTIRGFGQAGPHTSRTHCSQRAQRKNLEPRITDNPSQIECQFVCSVTTAYAEALISIGWSCRWQCCQVTICITVQHPCSLIYSNPTI